MPSMFSQWWNRQSRKNQAKKSGRLRPAWPSRTPLAMEQLETRLVPSTVTTVSDSGPGSLRQAILNASGGSGGNIVFDIPNSGVQDIVLLTPLPAITASISIDGTTQPGYAGTPLIEVSGASAGSGAVGLTVTASNVSILGLNINSFTSHGIFLESGGDDTIQADFIGTDPTGETLKANGGDGIDITSSGNTIGGTAASDRNIISGSATNDIRITGGSADLIEGNYVGTDAAGTHALSDPGSAAGIYISTANNTIGGAAAGAGNVISGTLFDGLKLDMTGAIDNLVQGNFIGTDYTGTVAIPNASYGVQLISGATGNTIGGTTAGAGNVIAYNDLSGVDLSGSGTTGDFVQNNTFQSNVNYGVELDSSTQAYVSGTVAGDVLDNGTFDLHGLNASIGALSGSGTVTSGVAGSVTLTLGNTNDTNTFSGVIQNGSGTVALAKTGSGTETLSGANTYTGITTVTAGTLSISSDGNLGTAPGSATAGNIVLNGGTLQATATFTLNSNRGIALGPTSGSGTGTIDVTGSNTLTYDGRIANNPGGTGGLTLIDTGTFDLGGSNPFTGPTTVSGGVLAISGSGGDGVIQDTSVTINSGAIFRYLGNNIVNNAAAFIVNGTLDMNTFNDVIGSISGSGTIIDNSTNTEEGLSLDNVASALTYSGTISGGGRFALRGAVSSAGSLTLTGSNYSLMRIDVVAGTLNINAPVTTTSDVFVGSSNAFSPPNGGNAVLNLQGGSLTVGGTLKLAGLSAGNAFNGTFTESAGTATVTGIDMNNQGAVGTLTLSGGVLAVGAGGIYATDAGSTTLNLSGGTLQAAATFSTSIAATLTNSPVIDTNGFNINYAGSLSGTGSLTKISAGILTLSASNGYSGGTTLNGGTLLVTGTLGSGSVTIASGAILNDQVIVTSDTGLGSLRQAITNANTASGMGSNTITFNVPSDSTITLAGVALPTITVGLTITGPGASQLTISGNNQSEIFGIGSDAIVSISGLTFIDGEGVFGGAIYTQGVLTVTNSTFTDNNAQIGGAIYSRAEGSDPNTGVLNVNDDTFSNNSAVWSGAIDNWAGGIITVTNSTLVGNSASDGGAIKNEWGTLKVIDSTLSGNSAAGGNGGAIDNENGYPLIVQNSIVAGNTATNGPDIDGSITTDNGHNLFGTALQGTTSGAGDIFSNSPLLAPLGNYGGPTETLALLPGSPAIDAGSNALIPGGVSTDQRGAPRIENGTVDIGAYEIQTLYWDPGHTGGTGSGGTGAWDTSTANWFNGTSDVTWSNSSAYDPEAVFAGSAGTVTLGTAVTAFGLAFNTTGYTVTSNTLTVGGGVSVASSDAATVASTVAGSTGLSAAGSGTLRLSGANTYTGTTTISGGTLQIGNGGTTGSLGSGSVTDNAALVYDLSSNVAVSNAISGTGTLTLTSTAGNVSQSAAIAVPALTVSAATGITLTNAGNEVSSFSATNSTSGNLSLTNTVTTLTVAGISESGSGSVTVSNTGALTVTGAVSFAGNLNLIAAGADQPISVQSTLTKSSGGNATADLAATGDVRFENSGTLNVTSGALALTLNPDTDGNAAGGVLIDDSVLGTNGGAVTIGGGATPGTTATGALIAGVGGVPGTGSAVGYGVEIDSGSAINAGAGTVSILAHAASGGPSFAVGIALDGGSVTTTTGSIIMVGTGGNTAIQLDSGVQIGGSVLSTAGGSISLTGAGAGTGQGNRGVNISGTVSTTGAGTITLTGTGSATGASTTNYGVDIQSGGAVTINGSGAITINATGGAGSAAFHTVTGTDRVGSDGTHTYSGNIGINANSLSLANDNITTTASVSFLPTTPGYLINVGGAGDLTTILGLTSAELGTVSTGTINIGNASSGAITVSAAIALGSTNLALTSGAGITESGSGTLTTTGSLTLVGGTIGSGGQALQLSAASLTTNTSANNGNQYLSALGTVTVSSSMNAGSGTISLRGGTFLVTGTLGSGSVSIAGGAVLDDQVISTSDTGEGSLRQAITNADTASGAGLNEVTFNISSGLQVINPASALPTITSALLIDGTTQPGYSGTPLIELDGASAGSGVVGLTIAAGSTTVKGLDIGGFTGDGIDLTTNGSDTIQGNYIGVNAAGTAGLPNGGSGVDVASPSNTIGGTSAGAGNLISGNEGQGILLTGAGATGNLIQGNFIGTNANGSNAAAIPGTVAWYKGQGNANDSTGQNNGTLMGGVTFAPGEVGQAFNLNGSTAYVAVAPSASLTPLTGVTVEAWIDPTTLPSANSPTGGWDIFNELYDQGSNLNGPGAYALRLLSNGSLQFLVGTSNQSESTYWTVTSAPGLVTPGTFTHVAGTYDSTTGKLSVFVNGVATTTMAAGTLNQDQHELKIGADLYNLTYFYGLIDEPTVYSRALGSNEIDDIYNLAHQGKPISLGNAEGVFIGAGASGNIIGGTAAGAGNVISGNGAAGVQIDGSTTSSNVLHGNFIGTNAAGSVALANGGIGVWLSNGASSNTIGGSVAGAGNVISGNLGGGVEIADSGLAYNNVLQGNLIGVDVSATFALGNANWGVLIQGSSDDLIGGLGAGNVISGNDGSGIVIDASTGVTTGILIDFNYIGTNAAGAHLGNSGDGVLIENGASFNTVGDTSGGGNVIAYNTANGVQVSGAASINNVIRGNSIFANGELGIDLTGSGNQGQAVPVVIAAAVDPGTNIEIKATFTGAANSTYTIDFYDNGTLTDPSGYGQGKTYLSSTTITTDQNGEPTPGSSSFFAFLDVAMPVGDVLTLTITDPNDNTSDFSNDVTTILHPTINMSGLSAAVFGQRLSYNLTPSASLGDLGAGLTYSVTYSDGTAPESFTSSAASLTTPVPHFFYVSQDTSYLYSTTVSADVNVTDQYGFSDSSTVSTSLQQYLIETNSHGGNELDVGALYGGSSFVLTGTLLTGNQDFDLSVDSGNLVIDYNTGTFNITPLISAFNTSVPTLANIELWGNFANGTGSNSFNTSIFTGLVDTHNGPGNNFINGSSLIYSADAGGDSITYIASPSMQNSLSFAGSDTPVTFNLGELSGQTQTLTSSNDSLTIYGRVTTNTDGTLSGTGTGSITNLTASNQNDTFIIPSDYTATTAPSLNVTGGAGNDTFTISDPTVSANNDTFTINNTSFTGGTGNDTFTIGGSGTASNDTFTIGDSSITGNDTFTIGASTGANDTFTIGGSSLSGNDTFTIGSGTGLNDTFTIDGASTVSNDTFTIGDGSAVAGNDTFTINNGGTLAGNDTFTINNSSPTANDTFTINNANASFASGNDTFAITDAGASNDTFTINGGLTSGAGSNDTFTIGGAGTGNDTFTINGGVSSANSGNDTFTIGGNTGSNDTFTINGGITTTGNSNDTFTIGSGSASNDTFTIGGVSNSGANDTFTMGSGLGANDTFTIGGVSTSGAGANDTFTIEGGVGSNDTFTIGGSGTTGVTESGANDTFTINDTGASNDTFTIGGGVNVAGNDTFTMNGLGTGNDTFTIGGAVSTTGGNDTFTIGSGGALNDTFTITGGISTAGGNDTFTIGGGSVGSNDTFTIGGVSNSGANDTFTMGSGLGANDTFTIGGVSASGAGANDTFTIEGGVGSNDTFTIGGTGSTGVTESGANDTFTISDMGASNDTFTIGGGVNVAGNDTFTMNGLGTGNDTFTINGAVSTTSGNDTFTIGSGGALNDTFTITGGISTAGGNDTFTIGGGNVGSNDTFTIGGVSNSGANDTFTMGSGLGANDTFTIGGVSTSGAGANDTFTIEGGVGSNDTFTIGGTGSTGVTESGANDTFTISDMGASNDTFTIGGGVNVAGNDTFTMNGLGTGNDTFTINGARLDYQRQRHLHHRQRRGPERHVHHHRRHQHGRRQRHLHHRRRQRRQQRHLHHRRRQQQRRQRHLHHGQRPGRQRHLHHRRRLHQRRGR